MLVRLCYVVRSMQSECSVPCKVAPCTLYKCHSKASILIYIYTLLRRAVREITNLFMYSQQGIWTLSELNSVYFALIPEIIDRLKSHPYILYQSSFQLFSFPLPVLFNYLFLSYNRLSHSFILFYFHSLYLSCFFSYCEMK